MEIEKDCSANIKEIKEGSVFKAKSMRGSNSSGNVVLAIHCSQVECNVYGAREAVARNSSFESNIFSGNSRKLVEYYIEKESTSKPRLMDACRR